MSLNYNVGEIKGWKATGKGDEKLVHDKDGNPIQWEITKGLIFSMMGMELGAITEKNIEEAAFRLAYFQKYREPMLTNKDGFRPITTAELLAHVGLTTNVTTKTRGQFLKSIATLNEREIEQDVKDELAKARGLAQEA